MDYLCELVVSDPPTHPLHVEQFARGPPQEWYTMESRLLRVMGAFLSKLLDVEYNDLMYALQPRIVICRLTILVRLPS